MVSPCRASSGQTGSFWTLRHQNRHLVPAVSMFVFLTGPPWAEMFPDA
jgi:hypothetical protein